MGEIKAGSLYLTAALRCSISNWPTRAALHTRVIAPLGLFPQDRYAFRHLAPLRVSVYSGKGGETGEDSHEGSIGASGGGIPVLGSRLYAPDHSLLCCHRTVSEDRVGPGSAESAILSVARAEGRSHEFSEAFSVLAAIATTAAIVVFLRSAPRTAMPVTAPAEWNHDKRSDKSAMSNLSVELDRLDHFALTVRDVEQTCAFYEKVLGMARESFEEGRVALRFGRHRININPNPNERSRKAAVPIPGSAEFCVIVTTPLNVVVAHLRSCGVELEHGPEETTGAEGIIRSIWFRDPDGNLVEVASYG